MVGFDNSSRITLESILHALLFTAEIGVHAAEHAGHTQLGALKSTEE